MTGAGTANPPNSLRRQVRSAVIWRSGTQIFAQVLTWATTFLVIRILEPADYGLYAMTGVVMSLLALLNGYGLANAVIQRRDASPQALRQLFGMLIVLNFGLALIQVAAAPLVAAYYRQPMVADLLRVQALLYLANPPLALGYAVLSRAMDFRRQAQVNVVSALVGTAAALAAALAGWGVWTLVAAPLALFGSRALGMALAAGGLVRPSFDFRGAGDIAAFGGIVTLSSFFWFVQTQADVIIAGRSFGPHVLGLYTTALFLAQIFVTKAVPPLNEVAFAAYAQVREDRAAFAAGFLKSVRLVMLLALPFSLGLAATAEPFVAVALGAKWREAAPIVALLSLAMPFMTLHVLFAPATNAVGRPGISTWIALVGALLLPAAYLVGARFGVTGLAAAWLAGFPLLTLVAAAWSLPAIGVSARELVAALLPPTLAGIAMALAIIFLDSAAPGLAPLPRLMLLTIAGGLVYGGWLALFARPRLAELVGFFRRN